MPQPLEVTDPAKQDAAVDWDSAKEFFTGGKPGEAESDDDSRTDDAPPLKEFTLGNRKIRVSAEDFEALNGLRRSAAGATRLGNELAQTRERLARLEGVVESARQTPHVEDEIKPPPPDLAITDFAAWQKANDAYHSAKMERHAAEIERKFLEREEGKTRAAAQKARDDAWASQFYGSYDHLDHPNIKPVVAQAYIENKAEIDAFGSDIEGAQARLAEIADAKLVEIKKAGKTVDPKRPPRLESSGGPAPVRRQAPDDRPSVTGASWAAKERARMRGEGVKK